MPGIALNPTSLLKMSFASLQNVDYPKLFEIAKTVEVNAEIPKWQIDPIAYAKAVNGFVAPEGYHMHIVDKDNNYYPPEGDALSQLKSAPETWTRIEVRAGYKDLACIICLWCKSAEM